MSNLALHTKATFISKQNDSKSSVLSENLNKSEEIYQKYVAAQTKFITKTETTVVTTFDNKQKVVTTNSLSNDISKKLGKKDGKKNRNKIQYKNKHLWSKKSLELENLLKPLVTGNSNLFPDFDVMSDIASGTEIGVIDILLISKDADNVSVHEKPVATSAGIDNENNSSVVSNGRDGVTRIFSPWSYFAEEFMFTKVWHCFYWSHGQ